MLMDMIKITNKEIQYNIMIALMQISGSLADMVTQREECVYDECFPEDEVSINDVTRDIQ
jgi:hypothetical protein